MLPVVPWSVWEIIKWMDIPTLGKNVVVVGRSKNVGMPIAVPIQIDGACEYPGGDATITIFISTLPKSKWRNRQFLQTFWSLIQAFPIIADMIKEGIALINMKIKRVQDLIMTKPTLVGEVDFEEIRKKAAYSIPVHRDIGPMTMTMLTKNTIISARMCWGLKSRKYWSPRSVEY